MSRYYIAYGSNLNKTQMKRRCPTAKVVGNGFLHNFALVFRLYATVEPSVGDKVPVTVWEIDDECEKSLDRYEGYPRLYYKEEYDIEVNGSIYRSMVYIMNTAIRDYQPPTPYYLNTVLDGYRDMGLDTTFVRDALTRTNKILK